MTRRPLVPGDVVDANPELAGQVRVITPPTPEDPHPLNLALIEGRCAYLTGIRLPYAGVAAFLGGRTR